MIEVGPKRQALHHGTVEVLDEVRDCINLSVSIVGTVPLQLTGDPGNACLMSRLLNIMFILHAMQTFTSNSEY